MTAGGSSLTGHICGEIILDYRAFLVLKHLVGFLEAAALLHTLSLNVALAEFLQEAVGPRKALEE